LLPCASCARPSDGSASTCKEQEGSHAKGFVTESASLLRKIITKITLVTPLLRALLPI
jgi:hypothetical protein